jgi:two-component system, cell cycle response regulator
MHVAVVDPSRVVLKMVGDMIGQRGDTVSDFLDSASALRSIQNDPDIDVLITSLEVQPLNGFELCWEARLAAKERRPLYIIIMSSLTDDTRLAEALDSGADDLIGKPLKRLELYARLRMAGRLKSAQLHLVRLAETDSLTGLLNRRAFFERLQPLLHRPGKDVPLSAVLIDIDYFKKINDTYGHDAGDGVIKRVAQEIANRAEIVGRVGGEEFAMILDNHDEAKAFRVVDSLRRTLERLPQGSAGQPFSATCSFGIAAMMAGDTADTLLKRADVALYQAKLGGRNRVNISDQAAALTESSDGIMRKRTRS